MRLEDAMPQKSDDGPGAANGRSGEAARAAACVWKRPRLVVETSAQEAAT